MTKRSIMFKTAYILLLCLLISSVAFTSSADVYEGYYQGIVEFVDMLYYRDIGVDGLTGITLNGAMRGFNEYSCFVLNDSKTASTASSGVFLEKVRTGLRVVSVLPDTTAYEAGIRAGDTITLLDKMSTAAMSENAFNSYITENGSGLVNYIEGSTGLTKSAFLKADSKTGRDVEIVYLEGAVYIRVNRFSDFTTDRIAGIIESMKELGFSNAVLDLRELHTMNIEDAAGVADLFMTGGNIARTRKQTYNASYKKEVIDLAVLIDDNTVGAPEAIAIAMDATIYGQDSEGYAVYTGQYPVFSRTMFEKLREETGYTEVARIINYVSSHRLVIEDSDIAGHLNIVESGIYASNRKLIGPDNKPVPDVYLEDTEMGYMNYSPGAFEIDIERNYEEGAVNYDVFIAKKILGFLGYFNGEYDVVFRTEMKESVNEYKTAMGFEPDGILDLDTQASLNTYSMKTAVSNDTCVKAALAGFND